MNVVIDGVNYIPEKFVADPSKKSLLDKEFYADDIGEILTLREYFCMLLTTLWKEKEEFSGKRPFGDSCWEMSIYRLLVDEKVIQGEIDGDSYLKSFDRQSADAIIKDLIFEMCLHNSSDHV